MNQPTATFSLSPSSSLQQQEQQKEEEEEEQQQEEQEEEGQEKGGHGKDIFTHTKGKKKRYEERKERKREYTTIKHLPFFLFLFFPFFSLVYINFVINLSWNG